MALPALFIPASLETVDLSPEVAERLRASWGAWWDPFREELRATPPIDDSPEERSVLARFAVRVFEMMGELPVDLTKVLPLAIQQTIERLLLQTAEAMETERRLGFHWLQQAVETLGRVVDRFAYAMPKEGMDQALRLLPTTPAEIERRLDPASTLLLRLELHAFVAWDLISSGTATEFCFWSRKAAAAAQRIDAVFPFLLLALENGAQAVEIDLRTETVLDSSGVATVLRLLDEAPGPNEAMLRLFGAHDQKAHRS